MKAVRFSLPDGREEEVHEGIGELNRAIGGEEREYVDTVSRNGSQQQLAQRVVERETMNEHKTVAPILCGLCCKKTPAVSVWNCDGEILPFTEIFCR